MTLSCMIIADHIVDQNRIKNALQWLSFQKNIDFYYETATSLPANILEVHYDIYFIDLDMDNLDGFSLANQVMKCIPNAIVILCSWRNELAFKCYRTDAFYFLRKTVLQNDIKYAIQKLLIHLSKKREYYVLKHYNEIIPISCDSIMYFEKHKDFLLVHTRERIYLDRDRKFRDVLQEVNENDFIIVSRNLMIHLKDITQIHSEYIFLMNGEQLKIPRRNVQKVMEKYTKYISALNMREI